MFAAVPDGASTLSGVMQLDDLGALVERGCLLGEAHHEHGTNGEVGSDQHANIIMPGEDRTHLVQVAPR